MKRGLKSFKKISPACAGQRSFVCVCAVCFVPFGSDESTREIPLRYCRDTADPAATFPQPFSSRQSGSGSPRSALSTQPKVRRTATLASFQGFPTFPAEKEGIMRGKYEDLFAFVYFLCLLGEKHPNNQQCSICLISYLLFPFSHGRERPEIRKCRL